MTVAALTRWLAERLAPAAGEDARFEARLMAAEALDVRPNELPGLRDEAAPAAARERTTIPACPKPASCGGRCRCCWPGGWCW